MNDFDIDTYCEITNSQQTYHCIAYSACLNPILIGWTDGNGSHYDILFTYQPYCPNQSNIQSGLKKDYLFVSIIHGSCYGFEIKPNAYLSARYISEKLGVNEAPELSALLTGVVKRIYELENAHKTHDS